MHNNALSYFGCQNRKFQTRPPMRKIIVCESWFSNLSRNGNQNGRRLLFLHLWRSKWFPAAADKAARHQDSFSTKAATRSHWNYEVQQKWWTFKIFCWELWLYIGYFNLEVSRRGWLSPEVAFVLLTQPSLVRISVLTKVSNMRFLV